MGVTHWVIYYGKCNYNVVINYVGRCGRGEFIEGILIFLVFH